ncbi:hypothetical protein BC937DRAFT_86206 [Endogone sp. FLAS-F59071]|nr:hypothetical protein BC937DRAFT_86206 [Endogone sp. FLAS-F59071]|eukprot:RUS20185.1 hypothetical protein BC937DRAFT_86206 [Endogone sp. FLAS-F59071]
MAVHSRRSVSQRRAVWSPDAVSWWVRIQVLEFGGGFRGNS